jgi:hypothetical protein
VKDLPSFRSEPETDRLTLCALVTIGSLLAAVPAFAQADLAAATTKLTLQVATAILGEKCRRVETPDAASLAPVSLHRTFHDDFHVHPLLNQRWAPHYAGGAWPEARYWGGDGSETQRVERCGFDFRVADAPTVFHNYGVLWQPDRITYFIDRQPVSEIKVPIGFHEPMYMIVNLAMGSKDFDGVGFVDGESPDTVAFEIDRVSAYQIDER